MKDRWSKYKKEDEFRVAAPRSVQDIIEIKSISENGIFEIGTGGIYTKTYNISDINYATASDQEKDLVIKKWCLWLNSNHGCFKITLNNKNRDMRKLQEDILFAHKCDGLDDLRDDYNAIIEKNLVEGKQGIEKEMYITIRYDNAKSYDDALVYFNTIEANMGRDFAEMGSRLVPLNAKDRLEIIHNIYRIGKEEEFTFKMEDMLEKGFDFKDTITSTYMDFTKADDYFVCDNKYVSALYVREYPSRLKEAFLSEMFAHNIKMLATVDVAPISRDDSEKKIKDLYMGVQKIIRGQNKSRLKNKDFSSEISYSVQMQEDEIKELMNDVRNDNQHLFWVNVVFLVIADSEEKLRKDIEVLTHYAKGCGVKIEYLYDQQREAFNTVLPVGTRQLSTGWSMETKSMPALNPFNVMELMMPGGIYYGTNKESKNPCIGNRKKLINANGLFLGTSGSGKTTQAKNEIMQTVLNTDDDVIVVDPKGDYRLLADALKGVRVELDTTATNHINILGYYDEERRTTIANEKSEVVHALLEICKKENLTSIEDNVVDKALISLYRDDTFGKGAIQEHTLMDLKAEFEKIATNKNSSSYEVDAAIKLGIYLQRFTDGTYGIFANKTDIDVDNRLIVFDLSELGNGLWNMAMLIMLEHIQERIYRNYMSNRATWVYIDELHVLLAHPAAQAYILGLWKKVRSLGGICTGITQNIGDLELNGTTRGILETSEFVALLKSDVSRNTSFVEMLGITKTQAEEITSETQSGRGLLRFGQTIVPFDMTLPKDSLVYEITDTNAHDKFAAAKANS